MDVKYIFCRMALVKLCKTLRCPVIKFIRSFNAVCSPLHSLFSLDARRCWWLFSWNEKGIAYYAWAHKFIDILKSVPSLSCKGLEKRMRTSALAAIRFSFSLIICFSLPCLHLYLLLRLCRMKNDKYGYRMQPIARCTVSCCRMKVYLWHFCFISPHLKLRYPSPPERGSDVRKHSIFWICKIVQSFLSSLSLWLILHSVLLAIQTPHQQRSFNMLCFRNQEPPTRLTKNYPRIQSKLKLVLLLLRF